MGWRGKAWLAAALIGGLGVVGPVGDCTAAWFPGPAGAPPKESAGPEPDSAEALERIEADEGASWDRLEEEQGLRELPDLQALAAEIGKGEDAMPGVGQGTNSRAGRGVRRKPSMDRRPAP